MNRRALGASGIAVSRLGLGTTNFGKYVPADECFRLLDRALEVGIDLIDTSDSYGGEGRRGWSEAILGQWLAQGGRRDRIVLATKVGFALGEGPNLGHGLSAWRIRRGVEASLRRLRTDVIDLYQLHHIDRRVSWDELGEALESLRCQGKIRAFGTSNFPAWAIADIRARSRARGIAPPVSEQHWYALARRQPELEVLPCCQGLGVGVIVYSPLAAGALGGRGLAPDPAGRAARPIVQAEVARRRGELEAYEALCRRHGLAPAQLALAWVLRHPAVTTVLVGPRTLEQLEGLLPALDLQPPAEVWEALDRIFPPPRREDPPPPDAIPAGASDPAEP